MEFFQDVLLLGLFRSCSRDGRWRLSRSWLHSGIIPESRGADSRCSRICLGRSVVDMDEMELMKESCFWEMNEDMSLEPRRLVRATLGQLPRGMCVNWN